MKKSTIWAVAAVMGVSFAILLYLQFRYFEDVIEMRKEQFSEAVTRSLYRTARKVELDETRAELEFDIKRSLGLAVRIDDKEEFKLPAHVVDEEYKAMLDSIREYYRQITPVMEYHVSDSLKRRGRLIRETIRQRYIHQKGLMDEVIFGILYDTSDRILADRVDFQDLDRILKIELKNNGVDIGYHFTITTTDGREVYRCPDYSYEGAQYNYKQLLFSNDSPAQMGLITVHFPDMEKYLYSSVTFMIPAIIFTVILLIIFIFTIYIIFRQKRLSEMKNDFINNMTHEFKTPISTISLASQMLNDPIMGKSEAAFNRISRIINDETKRLRFQVEKVLQMSMFDEKAGTFKEKELDANLMVADVVSTFQIKVEADHGEIVTEFGAENSMVYVDEMHFTNVLFNLLDNAVKYKKPGVPIRLHVATRNDGKKIQISIADNGIGIKKEDLKKVFDKFFRVHTGNRHDVKGFGLGLAYVKRVVARHKGHISAESEFGVGTTFIITLPIIKN